MDFLKSQYKKCFVFFNENLRRLVLYTTLLFVIVTIVSAIYLQSHPDIIQQLVTEFMKTASASGAITATGELSSVGLITNNIKACFMSVTLGIVPFLFLPLIVLISNAALIGAMFGMYQLSGLSMSLLIMGILPHGIFELPALMIGMALGIYLCKEITLKIIGKRKGVLMGDIFVKVFRCFLCIDVPLLLIAGIVEAYITPLFMGM